MLPILPLLLARFPMIKKLSPVVGIIKKHWKLALIVVLMGVVYWQNGKISDQKALYAQAEIAMADLQGDKDNLILQINSQNKSIEDLKKVGDDWKKNFDALDQKLKDNQKKHAKELEKLRSENVPQECGAAFDWLLDKAGK